MKRVWPKNFIMLALACVIACLAVSSASAAGATSVWVNGVELTASTPYWANGSGTASAAKPASGGYVYYDATAYTLTLHDALVSAGTSPPGMSSVLCGMYTNGDIDVVLSGASTISYPSGSYSAMYGLYIAGEATISGSGSLSVQLDNANAGSICRAIYSTLELSVLSGSLLLNASATTVATGFSSSADFVFAGGSAQIETSASQSEAIGASYYRIRITGGHISAVSKSSGSFASVLYAKSIYLEGGTGSFTAIGGNVSCGIGFRNGELIYTGGLFFVSGGKTAIVYDLSPTDYIFSAPAGSVFVSRSTDGSNLMPWTSDADGRLISIFNAVYSDFLFVRFGGALPQTGDGQTPLLWAVIALLVLSGACVIIRKVTKRRT